MSVSAPAHPTATPAVAVQASWERRLAALLIDGVALAIAASLLSRVIHIGPEGIRFLDLAPAWLSKDILIRLPVAAVYFPLCHWRTGKTLGKLVAGIEVVDGVTFGRLTVGRALLRWSATAFLWALALLPGLLDGLSPLWNEESNQAWHDRIANSLVIGTAQDGRPVTAAPGPGPGRVAERQRAWTSPALRFGFFATFIAGLVAIPLSFALAVAYALTSFEMFSDSGPFIPGYAWLGVLDDVVAGSIVPLLVCTVVLGVIELRRRAIPARFTGFDLAISAAAGAAAFGLALLHSHSTDRWAWFLAIVAVAALVSCIIRIISRLRRHFT